MRSTATYPAVALVLSLLAAACSTTGGASRAEPVPLLDIVEPQVHVDRGQRASADTSPPTTTAIPPAPQQTRTTPVFRTVVETVEVRVPEVRQAQAVRYIDETDWYVAAAPQPRCDETPFPINTAIGAGLGAIIGNQSGHSERGAWIGSGIGLLFDIGRWTQ